MKPLKKISQTPFESAFSYTGLTEEILTNSIRNGFEEYRVTNPKLEGPMAQGSQMHQKINKALREQLILKKWLSDDKNNILRIISPDSNFSIIVAAGIESTGYTDLPLRIRNQKGSAGKREVMGSAQTAFAFGNPLLKQQQKRKTLYLVHFVDEKKEEIRFELSIPINVDEKNRANEWEARYTFPPIAFDEFESVIDLDKKLEEIDDFDIQLKES